MECRGPKALALGATIALGSCQLAACADPPQEVRGAPLSAAAPTHEAPADPVELDLDGDEATYADVSTSPGFTPDPQTFAGTTAGGPVDLERVDERCHGWAAGDPDAIVRATRPFAELLIMAASAEDVTLAVLDPDGELRCGDDEEGTHPIVRGELSPGVYRVWVGTHRPGARAPFTLALTELDDAQPSSLLH